MTVTGGAKSRKPPLTPLRISNQGDAMNLRPLADRVIVKRVEQETKTASGIVIPDNAAEKVPASATSAATSSR